MTTVNSSDMQVGHAKIRLQRKGTSGPTVMFLHGAGGAPNWLPFFDALGEGRQLLVPDHPGFGESASPDWIRDVPDVAMFYLDLLDQLDLRDVHLVGHSLGGWLAAEIAIRNASRIKSLSLISPAGLRLKGSPMGDVFIWAPEEAVRNFYHDQSFADAQLSQPQTPEQLELMLKNRFAFARLAWQPRGFNPALEKWMHRVKLPTQVLWGQQDKVLPASISTVWAKAIPHAKVVLIDECGHLPIVEKAAATAKLVNQHLQEVI
jgi:pimeloyl-ACP methyl ester carboxylesterase